jgi:hypothetical protein
VRLGFGHAHRAADVGPDLYLVFIASIFTVRAAAISRAAPPPSRTSPASITRSACSRFARPASRNQTRAARGSPHVAHEHGRPHGLGLSAVPPPCRHGGAVRFCTTDEPQAAGGAQFVHGPGVVTGPGVDPNAFIVAGIVPFECFAVRCRGWQVGADASRALAEHQRICPDTADISAESMRWRRSSGVCASTMTHRVCSQQEKAEKLRRQGDHMISQPGSDFGGACLPS